MATHSTKPISDDFAAAIRSASSPLSTPKSPVKPSLTGLKYNAPKARNALTKKQKLALVKLARDAWHIHGDGQKFDAWRHAECLAGAGVAGISQASNADYRRLRAHFLMLLGRDLESLRDSLATGPAFRPGETVEDAEQARYVLRKCLTERGLPETYGLAICRQRFRCNSIDRLDAAQAMSIVFEVSRLYVPVAPGEPSQRAPKSGRSNGGRRSASRD